jgi:hypothetical protein
MTAKLSLFGIGILLVCGVATGQPPVAKFAKVPAATREGDKTRIEFAVDRETDVAVFIEDAKGQVIRHLVAGVLGRNPPPPLKADSLAQSVLWDGKADYDRDGGPGPFKIRVALGLGARYDKVLASDPMTLGQINALAIGPGGTAFVVTHCNRG